MLTVNLSSTLSILKMNRHMQNFNLQQQQETNCLSVQGIRMCWHKYLSFPSTNSTIQDLKFKVTVREVAAGAVVDILS